MEPFLPSDHINLALIWPLSSSVRTAATPEQKEREKKEGEKRGSKGERKEGRKERFGGQIVYPDSVRSNFSAIILPQKMY